MTASDFWIAMAEPESAGVSADPPIVVRSVPGAFVCELPDGAWVQGKTEAECWAAVDEYRRQNR